MRSFLLILVACFLCAGLCGCCEPAAMSWQPFPTFEKRATVPYKSVQVPYGAPVVRGVEYAQPVGAPPCP